MSKRQPANLAALRASGYESRSIKDEMRANLVRKLKDGEKLFPGIQGFEETVIPRIVNAILSRHDFILLGLRGQAKSRILRQLVLLLDDAVPILAGSEVNDDPLAPLSKYGRQLIEEHGENAPIEWVERDARYVEKLATPDVTIGDMIGDVDPIKAARGGHILADELTIHYGLLPRANRGIFAINELPDLAGKIQVGLFNILQEGDVQVKGYPIRLSLDVLMVFTANPEDYTARGKIITPLKDRISSQVLTHYPTDAEIAAQITDQEAWLDRDGALPELSSDVRHLIEEIAIAARESELVDQASGVSARMPISALELLASNLERRALALGTDSAHPRLCDFQMLLPAITGKIEMVYEGEQKGSEVVARQIIGDAVRKVFDRRFPRVGRAVGTGGEDDAGPYSEMIAWFADGGEVLLSDEQPFAAYEGELDKVPGLLALAATFSEGQAERALVAELILEGLHQHLKLARDDLDSSVTYKEMVKFQLLKPHRRERGDVN